MRNGTIQGFEKPLIDILRENKFSLSKSNQCMNKEVWIFLPSDIASGNTLINFHFEKLLQSLVKRGWKKSWQCSGWKTMTIMYSVGGQRFSAHNFSCPRSLRLSYFADMINGLVWRTNSRRREKGREKRQNNNSEHTSSPLCNAKT